MFRYADIQKLFHTVHGFQDREVYGDPEAESRGARARDADRIQTRVKMLRRAGLFDSSRPGRGPTPQYGFDDVFQLAVAMALMEHAIPAHAAAALVKRHWSSALDRAPAEAWTAFETRHDSLLAVVHRTTFDGFALSSTVEAWDWLPESFGWAAEWDRPATLEVQWSDEFMRSALFHPRCEVPLPFGEHQALIVNLSKLTHGLAMLVPRLGLASQADLVAWFEGKLRHDV